MRFVAGSDAFIAIQNKLKVMHKELEQWRSLSISTDYPYASMQADASWQVHSRDMYGLEYPETPPRIDGLSAAPRPLETPSVLSLHCGRRRHFQHSRCAA
jgi:hypothetical protein